MLNKYFIAIIPPEPLFSEIERIKQTVSEKYNNKSALRSPAHITLHMPFEFKSEKEGVLTDLLQTFKSPSSSFEITLSNYNWFEPKVVYVDVTHNNTLNDVQKQLVTFVKQSFNIFNQANDLRGFHPHITIAFRDLKKSAFYEMQEEYRNKLFSAQFTCDSFYLLKHIEKKWQPYREFKL